MANSSWRSDEGVLVGSTSNDRRGNGEVSSSSDVAIAAVVCVEAVVVVVVVVVAVGALMADAMVAMVVWIAAGDRILRAVALVTLSLKASLVLLLLLL